ncbi:putative RNA recognition motif domain, nucleotide-binding alpha-beta plait domain superfamily [Helianthus anomalus]
MRPPFKSNKTISNKNLTDSSPSDVMLSNLWVGNLTADVTELDLRNLFEKHAVVDSVTRYPTRSYAFVNMRRPEDAKRAKESLQAVVLRGFLGCYCRCCYMELICYMFMLISDLCIIILIDAKNCENMDKNAPEQKDEIGRLQQSKNEVFEIWTKMEIKVKPQGPRFKKFEIWTKMAKMPKPQGPK